MKHAPRPFAFGTVFEAAPPASMYDVDEELSASVLRTEIDAMRAAHADALATAYARGAQETEARIRAERDEALLAAIDALQSGWEDFAETRDAMIAQVQSEAAALALAIGESLAARATDDAPGEAIDQAIGRVLSLIARGQEVIVTVHPDQIADIENRVTARQSGDRRRLNILIEGDSTLAPGDAHLRWDGGGQHLDASARRSALEAELAAVMGSLT
jgi:flagellar assembly protein FliH